MTGELGLLLLIVAALAALAQAVAGLARPGHAVALEVARRAAGVQLAALGGAFVALAYAFLADDFSLLYVARNSNTALPWPYKVAAVWGAHEGSLVLWVLLLAGWTAAVARWSRSLPGDFVARVLGVMGAVSFAFLLFTLFTSNPYERLLPGAFEGRDLNPLLQDPGLVVHPPMLYVGYVGFTVGFAFAVAALLAGRVDAAWARWVRPWTTAAWSVLTVGIALGSWWAYYELGWGGWWFWDPVENASFMPWLAGTALIHSLAVTEKRGAFVSWTLLLAITAFALSLLGTFLVRSGVLVSVHAFANDPERGAFILALLVAVLGSALTLYAWRAPRLPTGGGFKALSRETFLLLNNLLLVVAAAAVLLGTVYPLFLDAFGLGRISVGPPYFNAVFVPLMMILVLLLGAGPLLRWKRDELADAARRLVMPALAAVAVAALIVAGQGVRLGVLAIAGVALGAWAVAAGLAEPLRHWRAGTRPGRATVGMALAHAGVGLTVLGVTVVSAAGLERDLRLAPGERAELAGYAVEFVGLEDVAGPNYDAIRAEMRVVAPGGATQTLHPEKRLYRAQGNSMTEAAISPSLARDIYVALGEPLDGDAWAVRVQYKPFVRLIWLGALVMAFGGLLALADRRYRRGEAGV